jgi:predicted AAA+ superfamily ATPase
VNLADELEYLRYSSSPGELKSQIELNRPKSVYIDEIQRLPKLLNTIQSIIDEDKIKGGAGRKIKFYLTGSSARKLRRGEANLLPGRIFSFEMGPFAACEFNYKIDTKVLLEYGSLPEVYLQTNNQFRKQLLRSYSANYLKEEIKAEALTRNLEAFARFLTESVHFAAQFVDLTKLAKSAKISRHSCPRYFEILEDTLVGSRVYPMPIDDIGVDLIKHPKFYFFDNGVFNGLLGNHIASLDRVGVLSEQLVFSQLVHSAAALNKQIQIFSYRPRSGEEVDFVVRLDNKTYGIEVKYSDEVSSDDVKNLIQFKKLNSKIDGIFVFHMGTSHKKFGPVHSLPWQAGLKMIGL